MVVIILLSGCTAQENNNVSNDVCDVFEDDVPNCWCDDSGPTSPILYKKEMMINNKLEAERFVNDYLKEQGLNQSVQSVTTLTDSFYFVTIIDDYNKYDEITVYEKGAIIKTICGV